MAESELECMAGLSLMELVGKTVGDYYEKKNDAELCSEDIMVNISILISKFYPLDHGMLCYCEGTVEPKSVRSICSIGYSSEAAIDGCLNPPKYTCES
jgi:hypothetical protein